jgi:hypothetical protein
VFTLLNAGRIRPGFLITIVFDLGEWEGALTTVHGAGSLHGKVLLRIGHD